MMRGFLKVKDGKLEWAGNWAMSAEAFDAGDKAKFRYEMRGDGSGCEKDGKIVTLPQTAFLDGSFLVKDETAPNGFIRMDEKGVKCDFEKLNELKWKVTGRGANQLSEFTLDGELDGSSRRMAVYKAYVNVPAGNSSDSESDAEEEEIDPTELADLEADQKESFGVVLGSDSKPKKRRLVEG